MLNNNFTGIQHIGIPVTSMERSLVFYSKLDFEQVMDRTFDADGETGRCCMMKRGTAIMELFQLPEALLDEIRSRGNGHIDHVTFDVKDINAAFTELKAAGFAIDEKAPVTLDFWERGCTYFNVIGPDGERLEFNQVL